MKSPSSYGSENEETNFIRRVADPDRPNSTRRHKKRLVLAGAATLLIGASAAVGYATLQSTQSITVEAPVKQQLAANLVVPDFVESLGDPYYPSFDALDEDGDGIVSYDEYMKDLHEVWDQDRVEIANSDLPDVVKEDLNSQLDNKVVSDSACVKKAMVPTKKRKLTFDRTTIDSLYYMLEVYCFDTPIEVPDKYMKMFPDTQAPVPPPAPVIPAIPAPPVVTDVETSAPIDISTPGGDKTVTLVGPPVDGQQKIEVDTGGVVVTTTVKVEETTSGGEKLNVTIPGGGTTTVTVPANNIPNSAAGSNGGFPSVQQTATGLQSVDIDTTYGRWTVVLNGPGQWEGTADLTIFKHDGSAPEKRTVDISPRADGSQFVHIFTGDENKMVVFPPLTKTNGGPTTSSNPSSGGSFNGFPSNPSAGSSSGGFPSVQQTTTGVRSVDIDTSYGRWTVVLNGPGQWEGTADITILKHDGSAPEKQEVDWTPNADGSTFVYLWTGAESKDVLFPPVSKTATTPTNPSVPTNPSTGGSSSGYPSVPQNVIVNGNPAVAFQTSSGRWTVELNGPSRKGTDFVKITIYRSDGSIEEQDVPVTVLADGSQLVYVWADNDKHKVVFGPGSKNRGETPTYPSTGGSGNGIPPIYPVTGNSGNGIPPRPSVPSSDSSYSGFPSVPLSPWDEGAKGLTSVDIDTPSGRWTVVLNGAGKWEGTVNITVLKHDGSAPETYEVDGSPESDGPWYAWVFTGDRNKRVVFPPPSSNNNGPGTPSNPSSGGSSNGFPSVPSNPSTGGSSSGFPSVPSNPSTTGKATVDIDTSFGKWTVVFDDYGPIMGTVEITILKHDGSPPKRQTVDIKSQKMDGTMSIDLWTGAETKTVVFPPKSPTPTKQSASETSAGVGQLSTTDDKPSVDIETSSGKWTVIFEGPENSDATVNYTIRKYDGSDPEPRRSEVTDGKAEPQYMIVWTGDERKKVPMPPASVWNRGSSNSASESGSGSPSEQQTTTGVRSVDIDTSYGRWTVVLNGPGQWEGTADITILKHDGSAPEKQEVDWTPNADGSTFVYLWTGAESKDVLFPPVSKTATTPTNPSVPTNPSTGGSSSGFPSIPSNPSTEESGSGFPAPPNPSANGKRSVDIDTSSGLWTVVLDGPGQVMGTADITILKHDGSPPEKQTVDISNPMADGSMYISLWTGDENKKVMFPPPTQPNIPTVGSNSEAGSSAGVGQLSTTDGKPAVDIETSSGKWTVIFEGPENPDHTVNYTLLKRDGSDPEPRGAEVVPGSGGTKFIYIWTADDKKKVPFPPASVWKDASSNQASGSTHGWSSNSGSSGSSTVETSVEVAVPDGVMIVQFHGPPTGDNKQSVTVVSPEGTLELVLDVSLTGNGAKWVNIPLQSGNKAVQIPGYGGTDTGPQSQVVNIETPKGNVTVETDGPIINGQQNVNITKPDGTSTIVTVDVIKTNDGKTALQLPSGPEGQTTLVTLPPVDTPSPADELEKPRIVVLETSEGTVKVLFYGPITDGKQSVTVLKFFDNYLPQQMVLDVERSTDDKNTVLIATGPGTDMQYVAIPPFEGPVPSIQKTDIEPAPTPQEVVIDTPQGITKVLIDGPVIDNKQDVTIVNPNGDIKTTTVDVVPNADGKNDLVIPGLDGTTTTVTEPTTSTGSGSTSGSKQEQQTISVDTKKGEETVTLDGPVVDGKQDVTITTPNGGTIKKTVDVIRTSDGKNAIEVPTGPEGQSTIITVPQSGTSSSSTTGSQTSSQATVPAAVVDTPHGSATVTVNGPVIGGKQVVTITTDDGKTTTTLVDAVKTTDGNTQVDLPTGPSGTTTTVTLPTTSTTGSQTSGGDSGQTTGGGGQTTGGGQSTTDILNQTGINDVDNGDKDFMSKDEFQLQIGTHFVERIKGLEKQTKDDERESNNLLDREKKLQDCILMASNKFGYYGVYEQAPYFQNAVDWVDNDCLKQ